uniref:THAP-type domain-containing protein n=1 Tax=Glossina brevipalpis TaxID=37001 RepID=A0A1A9WAF9_9MUSC
MDNSRFIRTCIARKCDRLEGYSDIVLHSFPANRHLRLKWCENLKIDMNSINTRSRVCSRHFEPEFIGEYRKKLLPLAFPTLELGYDGPPKHIRDFTPERKCKWKRCCIKNCQSDPSETYHYFPKDDLLKQMWITAARTERKLGKRTRICSQHFDPVLLCAKKLKRFAVPTRNLNLKGDSESSKNNSESSGEESVAPNFENQAASTSQDIISLNEDSTLDEMPTSTPITARARNKSTALTNSKKSKKQNTCLKKSSSKEQEDEIIKLKDKNLKLNSILILLKKCNKQLEDENKKLINRLFQLKESNNKKDKQILKFKYTLRHSNIKIKTLRRELENK